MLGAAGLMGAGYNRGNALSRVEARDAKASSWCSWGRASGTGELRAHEESGMVPMAYKQFFQ